MSQAIGRQRRNAEMLRRKMVREARAAFTLEAIVDNVPYIPLTRGQMNGLRATIRRLRLCSA